MVENINWMNPDKGAELDCYWCQEPMDKVHPGWRWMKMMNMEAKTCEANGWRLELHTSVWAVDGYQAA